LWRKGKLAQPLLELRARDVFNFFLGRKSSLRPQSHLTTWQLPRELGIAGVDDGVTVDIVKHRGPALAEPISIALPPSPVLMSPRRREIRRPVRTPAPVVVETEKEHV
jgi:hypothetical protein